MNIYIYLFLKIKIHLSLIFSKIPQLKIFVNKKKPLIFTLR